MAEMPDIVNQALIDRGREHVRFVWKVRDEMLRAIHEKVGRDVQRVTALLNPDADPADPDLVLKMADLATELGIRLNFSLSEKIHGPAS